MLVDCLESYLAYAPCARVCVYVCNKREGEKTMDSGSKILGVGLITD